MAKAVAVLALRAEVLMEDPSDDARIVLEHATPLGAEHQSIAPVSCGQGEDFASTLGEDRDEALEIGWLVPSICKATTSVQTHRRCCSTDARLRKSSAHPLANLAQRSLNPLVKCAHVCQ